MEKQNKFKIIIPSYNNEGWVEANVGSIISQTYTNYDVLYIDDASTDTTNRLVSNLINEYSLSNWKLIRNELNMRRGYNVSPYNPNITNFISNDEDIVVFVDGDDWLIDSNVLENLNNYYNKNTPWMTYGGMYCYPRGILAFPQNSPYSEEVHRHKLYRKDYWRASHLRTFKWFLYKKILEKDMIYSKSNLYYFHAEDLATSFPCLEMCPVNKIGVVDFPTYVFNETETNRARGIKREAEAGPDLEIEIRNRPVYDRMRDRIPAVDLYRWNRFDLPIKNIFLKFYDRNLNSAFGDDIYKEHLKVWNGFKEYDNPNKNSYEIYKRSFIQMFEDIKNKKFDWNKSPVIVDTDNYILNGSHRTSCAGILHEDVICNLGIDLKDGQKICDYTMFQKLGLSSDYLDAAALELIRVNEKILIVSLFPSATHSFELVDNILNSLGKIAYKKPIYLNDTGAFNYMLQLYKGEAWAGDRHNNFQGFKDKKNLCFTSSGATIIYAVEFESLDHSKEAKKKIRDIYGIGNHSVHINDLHEESLRLARCTFNKNSLHFLNNSKFENYVRFYSQLKYYEEYLKSHNLNFEDYCVTASSVLSLYGLKEGDDLDYLHRNPQIVLGHPDIHSHNEYGLGRYSLEIDDIIFNPANHFYYGNIKVASLKVIHDLKMRRGEPKDFLDVELINSIL